MAKNSGGTRTVSSATAANSRKTAVSVFGEEYTSPKNERVKILSWLKKNGFKGEDLEWIPDKASFGENTNILDKDSDNRPYWFNELESDVRDVIIKGMKSLTQRK